MALRDTHNPSALRNLRLPPILLRAFGLGITKHRIYIFMLCALAALTLGTLVFMQPSQLEAWRFAANEHITGLLQPLKSLSPQTVASVDQPHTPWKALALKLAEENKALRALHVPVLDPQLTLITAPIISYCAPPYYSQCVIQGGTDQGIAKDQAVIGRFGLVGRVISVGRSHAKVMSIIDPQSRLTVRASQSANQAILVGNGSHHPHIQFEATPKSLVVGETIKTEGLGENFAKNLHIGITFKRTPTSPLSLQLEEDFHKLDFVRVVIMPHTGPHP